MGDRTTVNLVVRKVDFENNKGLFEDPDIKENYSDTLISLEYYGVNYASLGFESLLHDRFIPYDKSWDNGDEYPYGTEYCRVIASGGLVIKKFSGVDEGSVNIDEAIAAYEQGIIALFLESKKNELLVMSWDDQEIIMQDREQAFSFLNNQDQDTIDALVENEVRSVFPTCNESAGKLMEELRSEGHLKQARYLINKGFLPDSIKAHVVEPYSLSLKPEGDDCQLPFTLKDQCECKENDINGFIYNRINLGIGLQFDGYGDYCSTNDNGMPLYIENYDGNLRVIVYSDISQEDPTHVISLEGARNEKRIEE